MMGGVSVILCTRNGRSKGFLREALRSVLEQSMSPAEVILIDDHSTDGTAVWVGQNFPQVKVMVNDGIGLAAGRNTGIRAAQNPWIAFIDDDDIWFPGKLASQLAQICTSSRPKATIWVARAAAIGENGVNQGTPVLTPFYFAGWPACLLGCPVSPSCTLISRDLLQRFGPFNENIRFGAAYQYWIRCLTAGIDVCYNKKILVLLRQHGDQMTAPINLLNSMLDQDELLVPFVEKLSPMLAARISLARVLAVLRSLAWRCGPGFAARYWFSTPLHHGWIGLRVLAYFLLDTAACRAPQDLSQQLRRWAVRLLLGNTASTGVNGTTPTLNRDRR